MMSPHQIGADNHWVSFSAGYSHTLAVKSDGNMWAWGNNDDGQLGDGTTIQKNSPVAAGSGNDWVSVATGKFHSLALKSDGTLWAWGYNGLGGLGDGTTTSRPSPVRVGTENDWVSAAGGIYHSVALKSDGSIWSWGGNYNGQLGNGTTDQNGSPSYAAVYIVADAGVDQHVSFGDEVTIDASASWDLFDEFEDLSFRWVCVQGCGDWCHLYENHEGPVPLSERIILNLEEGAPWPPPLPTFSFRAPSEVGSIVLQLMVRNTYGGVDVDDVIVTVFEDVDHAVFVSSDQSIADDSNPGTMEAPLETVRAAATQAAVSKICDDSRTSCTSSSYCPASEQCIPPDIYVQEGDYAETDTIYLKNHMSLYGGFTGSWSRTAMAPTRIFGAATAVNITGVSFNRTTVDGLTIKSGQGASPSTWDYGENSTAIYVVSSDTNLRIANNIVEAASGGQGGPAEDHVTAAAGGQPGEDGDWGFIDYGGGGGEGGIGPIGYDGGDGASCGFDCVFDDPFGIACGADDGQPGYGGYFGGEGGIGCDDEEIDGKTGRTGFVGAGGTGGDSAGIIVSTGHGIWRAGFGDGGQGGLPGGGGGGGAAGDGTTIYVWVGVCPICAPVPVSVVFGGGGGGGGEGGGGGDGGAAGVGGGGSFGLFLTSDAKPKVRHNLIVTGGGGAGGKGGGGQPGGNGGWGGTGGNGVPTQSDDGGDGGSGGKGGDGGGGGGGAGGASCGIYEVSDALTWLANNLYDLGPAGEGGVGGWPNGSAGEVGLRDFVCPEDKAGSFECRDPIPPPSPDGAEPPPDETIVPPGESVEFPSDLECTVACDATFATSWGGSDVVLSLVSPSGRIIDRNTTDPDVTHVKGPTFEIYTIAGAENGTWIARLFGAVVPPEGESVSLSLTTGPSNRIPVALCQDIAVPAGLECSAPADIDAGSYDPDHGDQFVSIIVSPDEPYPFGDTLATLTIEDGRGASDTCQGIVTVFDETPPELACPSDVIVSAGEDCQATVPLSATVSDACDSSPVVSSDALGTYPVGLTTVTFTAADATGNSDTCKTRVSVRDQTPPDIVCPADVVLEAPATLDQVGVATATDNCAPESLITNDGPADLPLGVTEITWSAAESYGNTATCMQTVTVQDTTGPTITDISVRPSELWPPNHKMKKVRVTVEASDLVDPNPPVCQITNVESDEPLVGCTDDDAAPDWVINGGLSADIRAERCDEGDGRVYNIQVTCSDIWGNGTFGYVNVLVPHDSRD
jgi:hypothetical protein